jgi:hypothetical protein
MSTLAWIILAAVLIPVLTGLAAGIIVNPHGGWEEVFLAAAYGTGAIVGPIMATAIILMLAHPSDEHGDQEAAAQIVFVGFLAIPLYLPALAGASIGKLLGRRFRSAGG